MATLYKEPTGQQASGFECQEMTGADILLTIVYNGRMVGEGGRICRICKIDMVDQEKNKLLMLFFINIEALLVEN